MVRKEIPDGAIEQVAKHINKRSNKNYQQFAIKPATKRAI